MKQTVMILAVLGMLGIFTSVALAADTITLPSKKGAVTFHHKAHQGYDKVTCKTCHHTMTGAKPDKMCKDCHLEKAEGKKLNLRDAYHKNCIGCHKSVKKGPQKCGECHAGAN